MSEVVHCFQSTQQYTYGIKRQPDASSANYIIVWAVEGIFICDDLQCEVDTLPDPNLETNRNNSKSFPVPFEEGKENNSPDKSYFCLLWMAKEDQKVKKKSYFLYHCFFKQSSSIIDTTSTTQALETQRINSYVELF